MVFNVHTNKEFFLGLRRSEIQRSLKGIRSRPEFTGPVYSGLATRTPVRGNPSESYRREVFTPMPNLGGRG